MEDIGFIFLVLVAAGSIVFVLHNAARLAKMKQARRNLDIAYVRHRAALKRYKEVFYEKGATDPETQNAYINAELARHVFEQAMNESKRARGAL